MVSFSGCATVKTRPPKFEAATSRGIVAQSGDVAAPGIVDARTTTTETLIPAGSELSFDPAGNVTAKPARDVPLRSVTVTENVTGPVSVAPPSPADLARGAGVRLFYLGGVALGVLAALAGWRGHLKACACFAAGAVAMPIVGNLVSSTLALIIGGAFLLIGGTLFAAWHFMRDKFPEVEK